MVQACRSILRGFVEHSSHLKDHRAFLLMLNAFIISSDLSRQFTGYEGQSLL